MAKDPNKFYLPDGTEVKEPKTPAERKAARVKKDEAYKASRERFLASREKYKNTPMPPQTPKEKADAARPGRVSGAQVAAANKAKRMTQGTQPGHAVTSINRRTGTPN